MRALRTSSSLLKSTNLERRKQAASAVTVQTLSMSALGLLALMVPLALEASGGSNSPAAENPLTAQSGILPRYAVIDLGTNFYPTAINNSNVVVGNGSSGNEPQVWGQGVLSPLSTSYSGWTNFYAVGLDDAGLVIGHMNAISPSPFGTPGSMVEAGCYWSNTNSSTAPTHLGPTNWEGSPIVGGQAAFPTAITPQGYIVGLVQGLALLGEAATFKTAWTDTSTNYWYEYPWQLASGSLSMWAWPTGAASSSTVTNWCGYVGTNSFVYPVINGVSYTNYPGVFPYGINASNIVACGEGTSAEIAVSTSGTTLALTNIGSGIPTAINNYTIGTNNTPAPQIIGFSGTSLPYTGTLWDQTTLEGTNTVGGVYIQKSLTQLVAREGSNLVWQVTSATGINDSGVAVGQGTYSGTNSAIPPGVVLGLVLLPCQFRLLNGSTNPNDVDGMDFNGNRPTTISATASYATADVVTTCIGVAGTTSTPNLGSYNDGLDVLGVDTPLGRGRGDVPFKCYTYSLMMLAKVMPVSSGVTYGWNRTYQDRDVTIINTTTNTWYVSAVPNPTGIPTPEPDSPNPPGTDKTIVPSINNNVIVFYDNPAMYINPFAGNGASTGDYAYEKRNFTYSLTNTIGSTNVIATQHVGTFIIAKRTAMTGTVASDWTGISNIASTTNIPDCSTVTIPEIRAIVRGTNTIILDPSVSSNYP
ncbi:MAG: hypothetical protein LV480_01985 [Methylacidiphilales bacterium]|nr:hypothetical protein [Candidatus Methylacidiphilales bacterium]